MTAFTLTETLSLVTTSCGGTSSATVRSVTFTIFSNIGMRRMSPGPRTPTNRPSRNTTPRSYSLRTLTLLPTMKMTRRITTDSPICILSPFGSNSRRAAGYSGHLSYLFHLERHSFDCDHPDALSLRDLRVGKGGPVRAGHENPAARSASIGVRASPSWPTSASPPVVGFLRRDRIDR